VNHAANNTLSETAADSFLKHVTSVIARQDQDSLWKLNPIEYEFILKGLSTVVKFRDTSPFRFQTDEGEPRNGSIFLSNDLNYGRTLIELMAYNAKKRFYAQ